MDSGDIITEEELLKKHKLEKKELQAKIQSLKKSIPKGDKKKKKEITEEIAKLELELDQKHNKELSENNFSTEPLNSSTENGEENEIVEDQEVDTVANNTRVSRAQKRRNKKEFEAKEREKRILEQAEKNKEGPRHLEINAIKQALKPMNLKLHNIPADGNCLYLAVNHQLQVTGRPTRSVNDLRKLTAEFMRKNKDDFLPFMCNELDESEVVSEEQFENYCRDVATTKLWGGQLELRALSNILTCPIKVIQAAGPPTVQGEQFKAPQLILTYHRYLYRLGEHYNSTIPIADDEDI
ncbi:deubiquitinase OTUD6B [Diorhabda carinulata]|uniref:deubiquitinase OTUD6B n=1 Tax=Diorhabda sublineata TaxID=1163346 RepID=UPI0024E1154E|nr:deubiquitinase OTUD6B [Diorhabda sublineata]XP_057666555.1 deubiquitinase OTUD6B [Diorhabda carinulata]